MVLNMGHMYFLTKKASPLVPRGAFLFHINYTHLAWWQIFTTLKLSLWRWDVCMSSEKSVSSVPGGAFLFHINYTHLAWGTDFHHTYVVSTSFEDGMHVSPEKKKRAPCARWCFPLSYKLYPLGTGGQISTTLQLCHWIWDACIPLINTEKKCFLQDRWYFRTVKLCLWIWMLWESNSDWSKPWCSRFWNKFDWTR